MKLELSAHNELPHTCLLWKFISAHANFPISKWFYSISAPLVRHSIYIYLVNELMKDHHQACSVHYCGNIQLMYDYRSEIILLLHSHSFFDLNIWFESSNINVFYQE